MPEFDTKNVIAPAGAVVLVGVIDHSWIVTPTCLDPADAEAEAAGEPEVGAA